jgi:hypothetical protein
MEVTVSFSNALASCYAIDGGCTRERRKEEEGTVRLDYYFGLRPITNGTELFHVFVHLPIFGTLASVAGPGMHWYADAEKGGGGFALHSHVHDVGILERATHPRSPCS